MPRRNTVLSAAHLVTSVRLIGAPLLVVSLASGRMRAASILVVAAIVSDIADGWLARRLSTSSEGGRWLDHAADIAFLLAGFGALAWHGSVPAYVPAAIAFAFAFYVVDSLRRSATGSLVGSRIGHLSGIFNYAILACVIFDSALGGILPEVVVWLILAAVPLYSVTAVCARILGR